jgi:hypothetical protein
MAADPYHNLPVPQPLNVLPLPLPSPVDIQQLKALQDIVILLSDIKGILNGR